MRRLQLMIATILAALIFFQPVLFAQKKAEDLLEQYARTYPCEKLYLHFDKESYLPGETVWYKAYLLGDGQPSVQSTNLYAGLYDAGGKLLQQQLNPVFGSSAAGSFVLPDTLKSTVVYCRAWTAWMRNFEEEFLFTKAIKILNTSSSTPKTTSAISLNFFPEGGDMVEGLTNTIGFKANDANGVPYNFTGLIKKQETGEVVQGIHTQHDGMGRFDLLAEPAVKYYAEWKDLSGQIQKTWLPEAKKTGVSLKLAQLDGKLIYNLTSNTAQDSLHILLIQNQSALYQKTILLQAGSPQTETVVTKDLPAGVVQLTVFNASWQPLAERVIFVNNGLKKPFASIIIKESSLQKRSKNLLEILGTDTIPANMSLSITDADMNPASYSNIESGLLLSGEVKGLINNPAYYFSAEREAANDLDLVMLTHGWRRYNWVALQNGAFPAIKYPQDNYLEIRGQLDKTALQKMEKDEQVKLVVKTKDSTQHFYLLKPDSSGLIKSDGQVFYDTARVYYSFKKNKELAKQTGMSSANYSYAVPGKQMFESLGSIDNMILEDSTDKLSILKYYSKAGRQTPFNKERTMESVVVKSGGWHNWKNDPMLKMDEKYTTGLFRGGATARSFDLLNDETAESAFDIYNYLQSKLGLGIVYSNVGKSLLRFSDGASPFIYIDENLMDNEFLRTITIDQIAYVKYFDNSYGRVAGKEQMYPTLAIYLKKWNDLNIRSAVVSDQKMVKVPGYSPVKEFYSPDYSQSNTNMGTDARTTLLWLPYLLTDKASMKIPVIFYTGDFTKRVRIVLEGINEEGRLLHIEKIIE